MRILSSNVIIMLQKCEEVRLCLHVRFPTTSSSPCREVLRQYITKTKLTLILTLTLIPSLTILNFTNANRNSKTMKLSTTVFNGCGLSPVFIKPMIDGLMDLTNKSTKIIPAMPYLRTHCIRGYTGHQPALANWLQMTSVFRLHVISRHVVAWIMFGFLTCRTTE